MANKTAETLQKNIDRILTTWENRVNQEVAAAHHQDVLALRDSLPEYLQLLVDALSNNIDRTTARKRRDKIDSTKAGKKHGKDRAGSRNYTMDQLITEYHILRQVVCDIMEEETPLTPDEREVIVCSIEQAVNDASTEYNETLKGVKESMANTLAHDLRNPITTTRISAELVLRKLSPDDPLAAKMNLILSNMGRLDQMIVGLLDASRLEAGQSMPIELKFFDFNRVIREVVDELGLSFPGCFKLESTGLCEGYWDENGVRRILENLLTNAIKYGEEQATITITLTESELSAVLSVHNTGQPIPKEDIPVLFEPYRRLESSKKHAGWGLGLTMIKGMVEAHKGTINVESDIEKGTVFRIELPKDARSLIEEQYTHEARQPNQVEQVAQMPKTESPGNRPSRS